MQMLVNKPDFIEFSVCLRLPDRSSADRRCCPAGLLSLERERRPWWDTSHRVPAGEERRGRGGGGSDTQLLVSQDYLLMFELRRVALPTLNWSTEKKQSRVWLILRFISERQVWRMQGQKYHLNELIYNNLGLCLALHRPESLKHSAVSLSRRQHSSGVSVN